MSGTLCRRRFRGHSIVRGVRFSVQPTEGRREVAVSVQACGMNLVNSDVVRLIEGV